MYARPVNASGHAEPKHTDAQGGSLADWIDALDWHCAACDYRMAGLSDPVCPECGRVVSAGELQAAVRSIINPSPPEPDSLWRVVRWFGRTSVWGVVAVAWFGSTIWVDAIGGFRADTAMMCAMAGLAFQPALWLLAKGVAGLEAQWSMTRAAPPAVVETPIQRALANLRGLVGVCTALCVGLTIPIALLEWLS